MGPETKKFLKTIQANENQVRADRLSAIQRSLAKYGKRIADYELTNVETALRPAIGRIVMDD